MTMNPIRLKWWALLMDLRAMVRYGAERLPHLTPWAIRTRSVLHLIVGNPIATVTFLWAAVALSSGFSLRAAFVVWVLVVAVAELVLQVVFMRGTGPAFLCVLVGWREGWRIRRRVPPVWAEGAAKTTRVQAEVGTSKEPVASASLRPVADHPKMSWLPRIEWPMVSWWVSPPPGRTFEALDEMVDVLAAHTPHAVDVMVDYASVDDSYGRLIVAFADLLTRTRPTRGAAPDEARTVVQDAHGLADVIELHPAETDNEDLGMIEYGY